MTYLNSKPFITTWVDFTTKNNTIFLHTVVIILKITCILWYFFTSFYHYNMLSVIRFLVSYHVPISRVLIWYMIWALKCVFCLPKQLGRESINENKVDRARKKHKKVYALNCPILIYIEPMSNRQSPIKII